MKVFVLFYDNGIDSGCDFYGVYSSKEKAEERINKFSNDCNGREDFCIEEMLIDEDYM